MTRRVPLPPHGDPTPAELVVQKKAVFLEALSGPARGSVVRAARIAGVGADAPRRWARRDRAFAQLLEEAQEHGRQGLIDFLEAEVERRAAEGVEKPVYQGGRLVGKRREYSDLLLMFLLKRLDPRYRDQQPRQTDTRQITILINSPGIDRTTHPWLFQGEDGPRLVVDATPPALPEADRE